MAIYIGIDNKNVQLISAGVSKDRVKQIILDEYAPKIGAIKYLARKHPLEADTESTNFDGWVYADGKEYSSVKFPKAAEIFGTSTSNTFKVPDLMTFIKPQPSNNELTKVLAQASVPKHYHQIDTDINYEKDYIMHGALKIYELASTYNHYIVKKNADGTYDRQKINNPSNYEYYNKYDEYPGYADYILGLHGAEDKLDKYDHIVTADLNIPASIKLTTIRCGLAGVEHPDAYPAHKLLQVMVYIGRN